MSADVEGDSYIPQAEKNGKHEANGSENASGATGQEGPDASTKNASSTTHTERLRCTGEGRFRDSDEHYGWRQVYAAMGVCR